MTNWFYNSYPPIYKEKKEHCAFDEYLKANPQDKGKPLMLSCSCPKCSIRY